MKYIYFLIGILLVGSVAAYTAADPSNVVLTLDETTYYSASDPSNVILTLDITKDTCTAPSTGVWEVNCNDNCTITSDVDIGTNRIVLAGAGQFTVLANISAGSLAVGPNCQLNNIPNDGNNLAIKGG